MAKKKKAAKTKFSKLRKNALSDIGKAQEADKKLALHLKKAKESIRMMPHTNPPPPPYSNCPPPGS
jgi:hypothetical protein